MTRTRVTTPHPTHVKKAVVRHAKPKPKHPAKTPKPKPVVKAKPKPPAIAPVVAAVKTLSTQSTGGSDTVVSILITAGLALAIACFALAALPAQRVQWRPAAALVAARKIDFTVVGFVLLVTAFAFFLIGRA